MNFEIDKFIKSEKGLILISKLDNLIQSLDTKVRKIGKCEECYSCLFETNKCPELLNTFRLQWSYEIDKSEIEYLSSSNIDTIEFLHSLKSFKDVSLLENALINKKNNFKLFYYV